jgi:hypothetical protein
VEKTVKIRGMKAAGNADVPGDLLKICEKMFSE